MLAADCALMDADRNPSKLTGCHGSTVRETIRRYFLDELDPSEPGAAERRVTFIEIDSNQWRVTMITLPNSRPRTVSPPGSP